MPFRILCPRHGPVVFFAPIPLSVAQPDLNTDLSKVVVVGSFAVVIEKSQYLIRRLVARPGTVVVVDQLQICNVMIPDSPSFVRTASVYNEYLRGGEETRQSFMVWRGREHLPKLVVESVGLCDGVDLKSPRPFWRSLSNATAPVS